MSETTAKYARLKLSDFPSDYEYADMTDTALRAIAAERGYHLQAGERVTISYTVQPQTGPSQFGTLTEVNAGHSHPVDIDHANWPDLFPDGRHIYYEGDNPDLFAAEIKTEFGFDPSADDGWGKYFPAEAGYDPVKSVEWNRRLREVNGPVPPDLQSPPPCGAFVSYGFHCPPEHLDEIYGSDRWPMGS